MFPSSRGLEVTWSSVVKIAQSLYREAPGKDPFRPDQKTPIKNFFLAGSYTKQVTFFTYYLSARSPIATNASKNSLQIVSEKSERSVRILFLDLLQDYIDSMEGATLSGRQASSYICDAGEELAELNKKLSSSATAVPDELSLV